MTGRQRTIKYMMQIPGHARCHIDGGFGVLKQLYRRSDWDSIDQLEEVVNQHQTQMLLSVIQLGSGETGRSFLDVCFDQLKALDKCFYVS